MSRPVAILVALFATAALYASPEWWTSDEAGFPIERLGGAPEKPADNYWWLEIDNDKAMLTKRLFQGSEERELTNIGPAATEGGRIERRWRGKALVDEIEYGSRGETLSETAYSEDKPNQALWSETYEYEGKRLSRVIRKNAEGQESGSRRYRYDPEGRLLSVELSGYYGLADVGTIGSSGFPQAFWQDSPDGTMRIELFDRRGNVDSVRFVKGDKIFATQSFVYDEEGRLVSDSLVNLDDNTKVLSTYGGDGRLATSTKTKGGQKLESHEYQWDKAGNLVVEIRRYPAPIIRIDRSWDENGKPLREERRENGLLVLVTIHQPDSVLLEETWSAGQLVVRTRFENGIKVMEEFYKNGSLIRTRNYR